MHQQKIAHGVDALYGVSVAIVGLQEPRVVQLDELARRPLGPELCITNNVSGAIGGGGESEKRTLYSKSGFASVHVLRTWSQSDGRVSLPGSFQLWKTWWMIFGISCGRVSLAP